MIDRSFCSVIEATDLGKLYALRCAVSHTHTLLRSAQNLLYTLPFHLPVIWIALYDDGDAYPVSSVSRLAAFSILDSSRVQSSLTDIGSVSQLPTNADAAFFRLPAGPQDLASSYSTLDDGRNHFCLLRPREP